MTAPFDFAQGDTLIKDGNSVLSRAANSGRSGMFIDAS